jgi:hypothetical protein
MENSEQEIALIKGLYEVGFSRIDYTLHLTTKRFVLIHVTNLDAQTNEAVGGLVGYAIVKGFQKANESKRKEKEKALEGLTLDELLQKDKKSFAITFDDIVQIKLRKGWTGGEMYVKAKNSLKRFSVEKSQVEPLASAFQQVDKLQEKFIFF